MVLGDDSPADFQRFTTASTQAQNQMLASHGAALRKAEEASALEELVTVYGLSLEEAKTEIALYRREQSQPPPVAGPPPPRPPPQEPRVPNFMKRQMALERGQAYVPQGTMVATPQTRASPGMAYPRSNQSSVPGGIFG